MSTATYPVHVDATLAPTISRWLWLVKWVLAIPHYFLLIFLWAAFVVLSIVAFFAILFTAHYPRSLFDFNVGVLRWSWRVSYYTYGALGTDRYPPFTLADVPDYPAHLEVDYPTQLSRGLVLVKWWLLAIPHYLIVAIFVGGGTWAAWESTDDAGGAPGLIGLLVLFAAIMLLFTGRYPQTIFDLVLGLNRWTLRVAAYAGLMTDAYPPFRLDMGGHESGGSMTVTPAADPSPATATPPTTAPTTAPRRPGWTSGRVIAVVIGSTLGLAALGILAGAGVVTWATQTQRDDAGYVTSDVHGFSTPTYAVTSDVIDVDDPGGWQAARAFAGTLRLRVTSDDPTREVFVGIAPRAAVDRYLAGADRLVVTDWAADESRDAFSTGGAPPAAPTEAGIWTVQASGPGTQSLTWRPSGGQWRVVVMNAEGAEGVSVTGDIGATAPALDWVAFVMIALGVVLLGIAVALIAVPIAGASRTGSHPSPAPGPPAGTG